MIVEASVQREALGRPQVALQNAVDRRLLGTATAVANFFRALGGTLGVALYGAVFSSQLARWIPELVPGGTCRKLDPSVLEMSPAAIRSLPPTIRDGLVSAVVRSADTVFLVAAPIAALALVTALLLREQPLRGPAGSEAPAQRQPEVIVSVSRARASAGPDRAGVRSDPR